MESVTLTGGTLEPGFRELEQAPQAVCQKFSSEQLKFSQMIVGSDAPSHVLFAFEGKPIAQGVVSMMMMESYLEQDALLERVFPNAVLHDSDDEPSYDVYGNGCGWGYISSDSSDEDDEYGHEWERCTCRCGSEQWL